MHFTGNDGYQNFSAFAAMLILDSDKKSQKLDIDQNIVGKD